MSKLDVEITRVDVRSKGNYFIVVQIDEIEYPSQLRKTYKFRTEIDAVTEFPQFHKTYFEFSKLQLGNRIILRFGLFSTQHSDSFKGTSSELFEHSSLIGSSSLLFTQSIVQILREHKYAEYDLVLLHPEKDEDETGHIYYKLTLKSETIDMKIYDDNKTIEDCYYDPFENNQDVIKEKLKKVIILSEDKQFKLNKVIKEKDDIINKLKLLAMDQKYIKKEKEKLEEENTMLTKALNRLQNFDEIHIEVDLLSQSRQGVEIIEKKYAILLSQLSLQNESKMELEDAYNEIDPVLSKIKIVKGRIERVKQANNELHFNIKRHEDMLPLVTLYQEQSKNNDRIVNNLKDSISHILKANPENIEDINEKLKVNYHDRKKLEEKTMQMNLYKDLLESKSNNSTNKNKEITIDEEDNFERIIGTDPLMSNMNKERESYWIKEFKRKKIEYQTEIEELTSRLDKANTEEREKKEKTILMDPQIKVKKHELISKIETLDKREHVLLEENMIRKLKGRIEEVNRHIEKEVKYAKNNFYNKNAFI